MIHEFVVDGFDEGVFRVELLRFGEGESSPPAPPQRIPQAPGEANGDPETDKSPSSECGRRCQGFLPEQARGHRPEPFQQRSILVSRFQVPLFLLPS